MVLFFDAVHCSAKTLLKIFAFVLISVTQIYLLPKEVKLGEIFLVIKSFEKWPIHFCECINRLFSFFSKVFMI